MELRFLYWYLERLLVSKISTKPFSVTAVPQTKHLCVDILLYGFHIEKQFLIVRNILVDCVQIFFPALFRCTVTKGFAALNVLCQQKYAAIRLLCSYISLAKCLNSFCEDRLLNSKWSRGFYEAVKCVIRAFLNRLCSIVFAQHALKILHCSDVVCCILLNISLRQNIYSRTL